MSARPGFGRWAGAWGANARLAWDTIGLRPTAGIPTAIVHVMDIPLLEEISGRAEGDYVRDPHGVYLGFQKNIGACFIDQYLAENPLSMTERGRREGEARGATTGAEQIVCDGAVIDSPEAVAEHLEKFVFPALEKEASGPDRADPARTAALIGKEVELQERFGPDLLKAPYGGGFQHFPALRYGTYGYVNYFMAYALFPELIARDFRLQADLAVKKNAAAARAIVEGGLPRLLRLDHDMADSRGTLVDIKSLDRIWFPHFARSLRPFLDAGIRLIWHCDGNLMEMVPRLLNCGLGGFQGFQYEDGMDYPAICRMKTRDGAPLLIWAGVSVTRTLPMGTRDDVVREMKWLVDNGPRQGLFLGASSSVAPGTNRDNVRSFIEGLRHYRRHGRGAAAAQGGS